MNREVVGGLAWAGGIITIALGATLARAHGYVDADTVTRIVVGINGLMVAWYGNRMPKTLVPSACARQVARVGGWALVLSGIVYASLWALAPIQVAIIGGCGAIIVGMAATLAYGLRLRGKTKAA